MAYQVAEAEKISGYLAAVKTKIESLSDPEEKRKFIAECGKVVDSRKTPDISAEAKEQLEYISKQLAEIYFRDAGWLE